MKEEFPPASPQCFGCVYKDMRSDGGHCYMFFEEPRPICMQHKPETSASEYGDFVKERLASGNYQVVAGVFNKRGNRTKAPKP